MMADQLDHDQLDTPASLSARRPSDIPDQLASTPSPEVTQRVLFGVPSSDATADLSDEEIVPESAHVPLRSEPSASTPVAIVSRRRTLGGPVADLRDYSTPRIKPDMKAFGSVQFRSKLRSTAHPSSKLASLRVPETPCKPSASMSWAGAVMKIRSEQGVRRPISIASGQSERRVRLIAGTTTHGSRKRPLSTSSEEQTPKKHVHNAPEFVDDAEDSDQSEFVGDAEDSDQGESAGDAEDSNLGESADDSEDSDQGKFVDDASNLTPRANRMQDAVPQVDRRLCTPPSINGIGGPSSSSIRGTALPPRIRDRASAHSTASMETPLASTSKVRHTFGSALQRPAQPRFDQSCIHETPPRVRPSTGPYELTSSIYTSSDDILELDADPSGSPSGTDIAPQSRGRGTSTPVGQLFPSDDEDSPDSAEKAANFAFISESIGISPVKSFITKYPHFLRGDYFSDIDPADSQPSLEREKIDLTLPSEERNRDYFDSEFFDISLLGSGEFSEVFAVRKCGDDARYAVKRSKKPFSGHRDRTRKLNEVKIMWHVGQHPHCVGLVDAWEQHGLLYMQMEYCSRGTLEQYLAVHGESKRIAEQQIWAFLADIASGLKHIHGQNIAHFDLKPENVLVCEDGRLKISDFGLAAFLPIYGELDCDGDRRYLAPEALDGQCGAPADIFSLGIIALEMAMNAMLPDYGELWRNLREGNLTDCEFSGTSEELVGFIGRLMNPKPEKRPTIGQVLEELRAHTC